MKYTISRGSLIIGCLSIDTIFDFYVHVFGLQVISRSENYLLGSIGDLQVELEEPSADRFPHWNEHHIGVYSGLEFDVSDMSAFLETVVKHGGKITFGPHVRPWGSIAAEIADPQGNVIYVSQSIIQITNIVYQKNFHVWHDLKRHLESKQISKKFNERDIWWCSVGENIGFEQDGKNELFERPVLIVKKMNSEIFF